MTHPTRIHKPVIAAVNGGTAGLGFVFAISCDIRYAAESAVFTTAFTRPGHLLLTGRHGRREKQVHHDWGVDLSTSLARAKRVGHAPGHHKDFADFEGVE